MKTIYTLGDSHAWHSWLKIPGVVTNHYGPMLMYSFGITKPMMTADIPTDGMLVFCWGEIDCRCHVHKYQPWQQTIDELVKNYFESIRINTLNHKDVWVYNVVPPPRKELAAESPGFPFLGTNEERLSYVKYMNKKLSEGPYGFVDVYDKYSDADGFLKMELSDGHVHIEDEKYLAEWIDNHMR